MVEDIRIGRVENQGSARPTNIVVSEKDIVLGVVCRQERRQGFLTILLQWIEKQIVHLLWRKETLHAHGCQKKSSKA